MDLSGKDVDMKVLEQLTTNVKQIQDEVLKEIVTSNMNTEYLRRFLHGDSFDKELFKKNVPVITYEDVKPYIDRIKNGEPSNLISAQPITGFFRSTGTSGGVQKLMPMNNKFYENMIFSDSIRKLVTTKHVDGAEEGKGMMFYFCYPEVYTPCGLPSMAGTSGFFKSEYFKNRPLDQSNGLTSPDEVILCIDNKQSMYCHLLCGLLLRDEVVKIGSIFASALVQAIKFLEHHWEELCSNIRSGEVSEWITDSACRNAVSKILEENPNPELADIVSKECSQTSWGGIIRRLWPKTKYIQTAITGSMAQYIPLLEFYSDSLPLVSTNYGSSESAIGINLYPSCKPEEVSYTFLPNVAYFEFLPVEGNEDDIVDFVDLKLGCDYEIVITNFYGLYRLKVGDILRVTGFYNNTPQLKFIRRENVVLSVDVEKTTEEDILKGVNKAKMILETLDVMLMGFTSYADTWTVPGHYVFYWELKAKIGDGFGRNVDEKTLTECCFAIEESLDAVYRRCRNFNGRIGALEIRVVKEGTFDSLMEFFVSQGASVGQYKTPICIKSSKALEVLEERVIGRFFSDKCPFWDSSQ